MASFSGVDCLDDIWAGIADPKVRRRLQNRINQRLSRRRRAVQKELEDISAAAKSLTSSLVSERTSRTILPKSTLDSDRNGGQLVDNLRSNTTDPLRRVRGTGSATITRHLDPHVALQPELLDTNAKRLFHYTLVVLLPTLGTKTATGEPLPVALHRSAMFDTHVFFGVLVGGAGQRLSLTQSDQDIQAFFRVQTKLVTLVRRNIEQNQITDGLLFAILALSIKRNDYVAGLYISERYAGGFKSPVKHVGGLSWLGGIELATDHIGMLTTLIRSRLSMSQPISPGLCEYMQMADLLRASLTLTKPEIGLSESYQSILDNEAKIIRPPEEEVAAFNVAPFFKDILLDMRITCRLIEKFSGSVSFDSHTSKFVQYRDLIQYRLLSLSQGRDEICRLATMIFNYGVIFAVPDPRPIQKLTKKLHFVMLDSEKTAQENKELLLWAAVTGGIAATGGDLYHAFITFVAQYATALRLTDWSAVLRVLEKFLWLDMACGESARDLWMCAVRDMNPSRSENECGLLLVL